MAEKGKNNAQLLKELREMQEANRIKEAQIADLNRRVKSQGPNKVFWTDKMMVKFPPNKKAEFMRDHKSLLKSLFMYADERKRKLKLPQFEALVTVAKDTFEKWAFNDSNGFEWKLKELSFIEGWDGGKGAKVKMPEDDALDIAWEHLGYIKSKIGDPMDPSQSVTPEPFPIRIDLRIVRYELEHA